MLGEHGVARSALIALIICEPMRCCFDVERARLSLPQRRGAVGSALAVGAAGAAILMFRDWYEGGASRDLAEDCAAALTHPSREVNRTLLPHIAGPGPGATLSLLPLPVTPPLEWKPQLWAGVCADPTTAASTPSNPVRNIFADTMTSSWGHLVLCSACDH